MSRPSSRSIFGPSSPDFDGDDEGGEENEEQDQNLGSSPGQQLERENASFLKPVVYISSEEDEEDTESVHRWGDMEDTATTVKPYQALLASLEQEHHLSLSQHVHSANLINRQQRSPSAPYKQPNKRRKLSEKQTSDGKRPAGPFITPHWTAWPLPPQKVPREADHTYAAVGLLRSGPRKYYHGDKATYAERDRKEPEPSQMLESTLMAAFIRISKEKIRVRDEEGLGPSVDDELSESMLRPVVRNVISKLDGLLTGLYFEREPYVKTMVKSIYNGVADGSDSDWRSTAFKEMGGPSDIPGEKEKTDPGTPPEDSKQAKKRTRRRRHASPATAKLNAEKRMLAVKTRDWSQILGIAALTGFAPSSLDKATQRCESLFGETMSWRCLRESDPMTKYAGETWTGPKEPGPQVRNAGSNRNLIARDGFMRELVGVGRGNRAPRPFRNRRKKVDQRPEDGRKIKGLQAEPKATHSKTEARITTTEPTTTQ